MTGFEPHDERMTDNMTPTIPDTEQLGADDPRLPFSRAVALAGTVIAAVKPDQFDRPTPCPEYDVRHLTGHLVGVLHRVATVGRGQDASTVPVVVEQSADDRWLEHWTEAAHDVRAVWDDPSILGRQLVLPFATLPGAAVMGIYTSEVTVHTWDLATATGQQPAWDDAVVAFGLAAMRQALPAERTPELPFAAVVAVPDDASTIDQLVAWNGRRP
jgi:uncharacterized protein (TIGR03086 family)